MKLLIVDDEPSIRKAMERVAKACGWESWSCDQFGDIELLIRENGIDVMLCDYRMPPLTGVELAERIRSRGLHLPIIVMTASPDMIYPPVASRVNIRQILRKPVPVADLETAIAHVMQEVSTHGANAVVGTQ